VDSNKISDAASITTGKGAKHVDVMEKLIYKLIDHAQNYSNTLLNESESANKEFIIEYLVFLSISILLIFFIAIITIRKIRSMGIQQKNDKDALKESESFIKSVMDNLPIGVAVNSVNPEAIFTYMNDAFPKHYHTTREELEKPDNFWNSIFEDEDYRKHISARVIDDCASGDPSKMHWDNVEIKKDGEIVAYINARNTPFDDENIMISTVIDVTKKTVAENALERSNKRLNQVQKMESISTLIGGIAHDFNNILFIISGNIQLLMLDCLDEQKENFEAMNIATDRGVNLIKQIGLFTKQSSEKLQNIDITSLIKENIDLSRSSIPKNIDIISDIEDAKHIVKADQSKIGRIALNLITNAFHAVEETNGKITITLRNVNIQNGDLIKFNLPHGNYVQLIVTDNGYGIPPDIVDRIFDPYFTTKEKEKGTGLGLSIVYGIVKEAGGFVNVYSEVDRGTTFNIYIPSVLEKEPEPIVGTEFPVLDGTESIMIVDDEKSITTIMKRTFEKRGYKIKTFLSPVEALKEFKKNPDEYDLVITDMSMPGMTGTELSVNLLKIKSNLSIILCSGFSDYMSKADIEEMGIEEYLTKPVDLHKLLITVRRILNNGKE